MYWIFIFLSSLVSSKVSAFKIQLFDLFGIKSHVSAISLVKIFTVEPIAASCQILKNLISIETSDGKCRTEF